MRKWSSQFICGALIYTLWNCLFVFAARFSMQHVGSFENYSQFSYCTIGIHFLRKGYQNVLMKKTKKQKY